MGRETPKQRFRSFERVIGDINVNGKFFKQEVIRDIKNDDLLNNTNKEGLLDVARRIRADTFDTSPEELRLLKGLKFKSQTKKVVKDEFLFGSVDDFFV